MHSDDEVIAAMQVTFIPGLARRGEMRMQIEAAVRVTDSLRETASAQRCSNGRSRRVVDEEPRWLSLTSDASRVDAHRFHCTQSGSGAR